MTIDIGTGDGRSVLDTAARHPEILVVGLDANAAAMEQVSRRAAKPERKGGVANLQFVVAAAEKPPAGLTGIAGLVTVRFPWGSLLRGCVGLDPAVAGGIAALAAPTATLELLLAPARRDGLAGVPTDAARIVAAALAGFEPFGFNLSVGRPATAAEIAASGSTWAKRLAAGRRHEDATPNDVQPRSVTVVRLVRRER